MTATLQYPQGMAAGLLIAATGILYSGLSDRAAFGQARAAAPVYAVPAVMGPWRGVPLTVDHRAVEILETEDVVLMEYHRGNEPAVWLASVAGFGNRAAFHPPELCYVGSHFEVLEREKIMRAVNGQQYHLMRLLISEGGKRYEAWYWFTANGRMTPSYYQQQLWLLSDAVKRKPAEGTLVRISTPVDEPKKAQDRLAGFLESWNALKEGKTNGS